VGFNRGHFFSALAGLIVGALLIGALPGMAANGDTMLVGQKNNAQRATKLVSKGGLHLNVGKPGNPALTINVVAPAPPMVVNSTGLVTNLNADLLDGMQASAFATPGHAHGGGCRAGLVMRGLDGAGEVICAPPPLVTTLDSIGEGRVISSLALDASGHPVIAYHDNTDKFLKLAHCLDSQCGNAFITTVDDTGWVGGDASLVLDASGYPVIAYYDLTGDDLKVAHCTDPFCAGATLTPVDDGGSVTSLTLDASGYPVIAYYTSDDLKVAHCTDADCTAAAIYTVDGTGVGGTIGRATSLALDASGYPVIAYYDNVTDDLNLAHCTDVDCMSTVLNTVDGGGDVGWDASLALDASGYPVISYYDATNKNLKVAHCTDANCTDATITTVDDSAEIGLSTSLALSASGNPMISYYDSTNKNLKVALCADTNCSTALISTVDDTIDVGRTTSLAINAFGYPVISYYENTTNGLKVAFG